MLSAKNLQSGFSLLEFLVAVAILAQLLAAVFSLETKVFRRLNQSKEKFLEEQLARQWSAADLSAYCSLGTGPGNKIVSCNKLDLLSSRTFIFSGLGE